MATDTRKDVLELLSADHDEFLSTIGRIKESTDTATKRELADTLIAELVQHSVAEEMWVYPAMSTHMPDGDAAVEHDKEEHAELEQLLKQLEGSDPAGSDFDETIGRIEQVLRDHVDDEEDEQFPKLRAHVPAEELRDMAQKVEATKKIAPTRPHPEAPNSELFHKTVGTGVGMVDRLRDKLMGRPLDG